MSISAEAVRASLKRHVPWLKDSVHDDLIGGLRRDGLVHDDAVHAGARVPLNADVGAAAARGERLLTPIQAQAASEGNANLLRAFKLVNAQAKRFGIEFSDKSLSIHEVDAALKSANVPLETRFQFKTALRELKIL